MRIPYSKKNKFNSNIETYYLLCIYFQSLLQLYLSIKREEFELKLETRYINILRSYITPDEKVLCEAFETKLIQDAGNNNFHYFIQDVFNKMIIENKVIE